MVDVKARLISGEVHDTDSTKSLSMLRGRWHFAMHVKEVRPLYLKMVMAMEIVVPEEYVGDVIGHINAKRGEVSQMQMRGQTQFVQAALPLSNTFGYATELRSATQGRGTYTMQFSHYAPVAEDTFRRVVGH